MVRVVGGAIALALRLWPLRLLRMVAHQGELLEQRVNRLLIWGAVLAWSIRYLAYLGLLDSAWSFGQALLATKLERGTIAISLGNVLEFVLTVWLAYLLSRFLRFVLQEDVYPRIDLAAWPVLCRLQFAQLHYPRPRIRRRARRARGRFR